MSPEKEYATRFYYFYKSITDAYDIDRELERKRVELQL